MAASQIHPRVNIAKYGGEDTTLGQKLAIASIPVVLASDQSPVEVTTVGSSITRIYGELDDVLTQQPMENGSAQVRITALRGLHSSLRRDDSTGSEFRGQTTMAESIPVAIASNQSAVSITNSNLTVLGPTVKSEDAAHVSTTTGLFVLAVRNDASAVLTSDNFDYSAIAVDSAGRIKQASEYSSVGGTPDRVTGIGAEVDDSTPSATAEGTIGSLRMTSQRALRVAITNTSGDDMAESPIATEATLASIVKTEDTQHASQDKGVMSLAVKTSTATSLASEGDYHPLEVDGDGRLHVNPGTVAVTVASLPLPTGASTLAEQQSQTSLLASIADITQILSREDAVHSSGDYGVMALSVRQNTAAALGDLDGDYQPLITDGSGRLHVNVGVSALPSGAATLAEQVTQTALLTVLGDIRKQEDALHASGDFGFMPLSVRQDTAAALSSGNGDYQPIITDSSGRLHVNVGNTVGIRITDGDTSVLADVLDLTNSNPLTVAIVDGSGTQITSFGGGTQFAEDAAHTTGDVGTLALARRIDTVASSAGTSGDYATLNTDSAGRLYCNVGSSTISAGTTTAGTTTVGHGLLTVSMGFSDDDDSNAIWAAAEDKYAPLRQTNKGAAWSNLRNNAGAEIGTTVTPVNVQIGDGSNQATIRNLAANDALNVAIVDGSGAHITSFGGGTQYTEGDTDLSITGTAMLWEDASETLATVNAANGLPVTLRDASGNRVGVVSGAPLLVGSFDPGGVVVTSSVIASEATLASFAHAEDSAHSSGHVGMMSLAVRRDADTTLVNNDNDYAPLQVDASGSLKVKVMNTVPVSGTVTANQGSPPWQVQSNSVNIATEATLAAVDTSLNNIEADLDDIRVDIARIEDAIYQDEAAFTLATSKLAMIGGHYKATTDTVSTGTVGALHMTANRALHVHQVMADGTSMIDPVSGDFTPTGNPMPFMVTLKDGGSKHFLTRGQAAKADTLPVSIASDQTWAHGTLTTLMTGGSTSDGQLQSTTIQTGSADLLCDTPRVLVYVEITKTGSPTRFQLFFQWSDDDSTYWTTDIGPYAIWTYGASEVSGTYRRCFPIPAMGRYLRIQAQASGTANGSNYFTVIVKAKAVYP